jgi:hypothetical protein
MEDETPEVTIPRLVCNCRFTASGSESSLEGIVVDIDSALIEVGGVEIAIAFNNGAREPGVAGANRWS